MSRTGYEKRNPSVIQAELMSRDLKRIVDIKLKKCLGIKRTIAKIGVEEKGENNVITTESVPYVPQ